MLERRNKGKKIGVKQLSRDFSKLAVAAGEKITMNYLTSAASIFNKFFASNALKDTAFCRSSVFLVIVAGCVKIHIIDIDL